MVCRLMLVCHVNHGDIHTILVGIVRVSLRTARVLMFTTYHLSPMKEMENLSDAPGGDGARMNLLPDAGTGRLRSVPFVSQRPGAYGRLLLAVYVRWKMGLLVASDWLRPVMRGAGGRTHQSQSAVRLTSADYGLYKHGMWRGWHLAAGA